MKLWKYFIAVFCILLAVLGLAEAIGVLAPFESMVGELSFWRITFALFFLCVVVHCFVKRKFGWGIFNLSFLFICIESNIAYVCGVESGNLISNWQLLFCTILICIGLSMLLPKRWKKHWDIGVNGSGDINISNGNGYQENNLSSRTMYIDCATFTEQYVENNLGATVIRFENADAYIGGGLLRIENNLGSITIYVPAEWNVDCQIENNLGSVQNRSEGGGKGPSLMIAGENNLGAVTVQKC